MITITEARQLTMDALSASTWIAQIETVIKESVQRGEWGAEVYSPSFYARFISDDKFRIEISSAYPGYMIAADPNRSSVYISWYDAANPLAFDSAEAVDMRRALDRGLRFYS